MKVLYLMFWVCALVSGAASEEPFPAADALLPQHEHAAASGPTLTLDEVERIALLNNPEIRVAVRRVAVFEAHAPEAGALDDPSLMYRGWQVPLRQPWNYNAAMNMFSVSQTFPGFGKRGLRNDIAQSEVIAAKAALDAVRLDIRIRVRKAFYDLLRTVDELRVHDGHVAAARHGVEAARIKYTVGKVPQPDILKAQVALTRLAEHLIHFEQDAELARIRLNTLLGRSPRTQIAVAGESATPAQLPGPEELERLALTSRPDLAQAQAMLESSRKERTLAGKSYMPDLSVSAGYMLLPSGSEFRNNYMIEGSINLPWLNRRKHDAEIAEATAKVSEQDAELVAMRNAVFGQIQEALAQAAAAQKLVDVFQRSLRPQAEATLRSTVIAYENDRADFLNLLDSQTTVLDIDLAYFQALADFQARLAELELAVGAPIDRVPEPTPEVVR